MAVLHVKTPNGVTKAYDLDKMGGIPVGFEHFSMNPNVPQGWLPLLGGEYNRATYPDLWAWVQAQTGYCKTEAQWQELSAAHNGNVPFYSSGNGSTTFRVPSLHCWVKGSDGSAQLVGSYLAAGLPNITGGFSAGVCTGHMDYATGAFEGVEDGHAPGVGLGGFGFVFDASRSSSIVGMWLVKAYGTIEETGTINEQQYIDDRFAQAKAYTDSHISVAGCVQAYAGSDTPTGWLLCDGSAISRTTYAALFAVIGTTYGAGDGSTTFNLPDMQSRFVYGSWHVGDYFGPGLPDIWAVFRSYGRSDSNFTPLLTATSGAIGVVQTGPDGSSFQMSNSYTSSQGYEFHASWSNSIYGASDTVQPPALTMRYIIKY